MRGSESFGDHCVFFLCDVRAAGTTEIADGGRVRHLLSATQVARQEEAHVFSEGYTQIARALAGAALDLRLECDLGARHQDGAIIAQAFARGLPHGHGDARLAERIADLQDHRDGVAGRRLIGHPQVHLHDTRDQARRRACIQDLGADVVNSGDDR